MATTTNNSNTPNQGTSIDEALGQTELGGWIAQNKTPVLAAVVLIFVGVFAFGGYRQYEEKTANKNADALNGVIKTNLETFTANKTDAATLVAAVEGTWSTMGSFDGAFPYVFQAIDALRDKGNNTEAYQLVQSGLERVSSAQTKYFVLVRAAALAEDLGKKEEAISHLKAILASGVKYMEGKVYLDLGRLYRDSGNTEMAKTSFQWVVDEGKEAEFKKMAKLYLEEMN